MPETKANNLHHRVSIPAIPLELGLPSMGDEKNRLVSVLLFVIGGSSYAIGVENTEGVVDCPRITPLPRPPDGVAGLASVHGKMTIVMDLGSKPGDEHLKQRLILVRGNAQLGLLADRIEGVLALEPKNVHPVAHGRSRITSERAKFDWPASSYFKSGRTRIPILDIEQLSQG
jgi:chemotaxis signal transduction protein